MIITHYYQQVGKLKKAPYQNQGSPGLFQVLNCSVFFHRRPDGVINIHNCSRRRVCLTWENPGLEFSHSFSEASYGEVSQFQLHIHLHLLFISRACIKWEVQLVPPCSRWHCPVAAGEELRAASSASYLSFQHCHATETCGNDRNIQ